MSGKTQLKALERAVELAPDSAENQFELGIALREAGRYDEAEQALQRAINLRPEYVNGPLELGFLYYTTNRYDAAANQFRLASALAPLNVGAYNNLGGLMYYLGRFREAREAFEASLAASPNSIAYSQLGTMNFDDGYYTLAADMFERAVELEPNDCVLAGNLATSYYWGGDSERAAPALRRAIEVCERHLDANPHDQLLMANLAGYYGILGEGRERGLALLGEATSSEIVDAQLLAVIGESYEDLGERDLALEWLGKALEHGLEPTQLGVMLSLEKLREDPRYGDLVRSVTR